MKTPFYRNLPRDCWTPETEAGCARFQSRSSDRFHRIICPVLVLAVIAVAIYTAHYFYTEFFL